MRTLFTAGMILAFSSTASAQDFEGFVCVTKQTVGFQFNKNNREYEQTNFPSDSVFLIIRSDSPDYKWDVKKGMTTFYHCAEEINEGGFLVCGDGWRSFSLNKYNLRFIESFPLGYNTRWDVLGEREPSPLEFDLDLELYRFEGDLAPYMAIGTCTAF